ncbi:transcriptional regulator [Citrobacter amalonaticus]|uniref:Transcriptional regulator n=1 Tax=Citrobacter amalonaticus TaxID=35703 RepID=A0A2S4S0Y9_CITAM|nr:Crp/Fnr family transcriptional regulator [Citrobacter amalonaticus]POT58516.1 transcriptional regulator [Citrobacter amalonaticus]POT75959.1 transcriptional regulator [Citrobacter amalonaticus]POU67043.1 transcriptional regulator [Citrobacter amalonaticus]POV05194.1 transcriptional regulator [Citrobacter amalonaticus]
MKSDIHKLSIPVVPLGNPFPPRHCSLCPRGSVIDRDNQHRLIDKRRRFKTGEIIARQDEPADKIFVIHEGYCTASVEYAENAFVSRFYVPGDIMALDAIEGRKYLTTIKASTAAEICHIDIARLFEAAEQDVSVAVAVIKFLCRDNGFIVEKMRRYAKKNAEARIAAFLVEFYEMHLRIGRPETTFRLPCSREEIASYLDLKIETVSRSLKSLEQQNLITLHRVRTVTLNSYLGLKSLI